MHTEEEDSLKRNPPKRDRTYTTHAEFREQRPGPSRGVWWRNPTAGPMGARYFVGPREGLDPRARKELRSWSGFYVVTLAPGQTAELPVEWSVQVVAAGRVVAGKMPRAQRVEDPASGLPDPPPVELHPALDDARTAPVRRRRRPGGEA